LGTQAATGFHRAGQHEPDGPEYDSWRDDPAPDLPIAATLAGETRSTFGHR